MRAHGGTFLATFVEDYTNNDPTYIKPHMLPHLLSPLRASNAHIAFRTPPHGAESPGSAYLVALRQQFLHNRGSIAHYLLPIIFFLLSFGTASWAQEVHLQGIVLHEGHPLPGASVMEIDADHRILAHTYSDDEGRFALKTKGTKTSLRVTAHGMRRFTRKIGGNTQWQVELKTDNTPEDGVTARMRLESMKLLVGRMGNRAIPQITWVEQLTDTTFTLVVPVRMPTMVEEYPVGRKLTVTNFNGHVVALGECIEQATPEEGLPQSWDPYVYFSSGNSADNTSAFTTDDRDYFAYPRFRFTKEQLEYLIDHSSELACFAVDTSRGDNYWMFYPSTSFSRQLQKMLNKMLK